MSPDRTVFTAALAIVGSICSLNLGAAIAKNMFAAVGFEGAAALRTGIAALLLLPLARPWSVRLSRAQWGWVLLYGLTMGVMNLLIYWSFMFIPVGIAVAIEIVGPLALVLAGSRTLGDWSWALLALAGLALLVPWTDHAAALDGRGVALALAAAACWAAYILFGKQVSRIGGRQVVALGLGIACLVTVPLGIGHAGTALLSPGVLATGALVAVLSSCLPYMLEMFALGRLSPRLFGLIISAAPAAGALAGYAVLGERLTLQQGVAVALMIAASAGAALTGRPAVSRPREDFG
ncbi:EamA family transporter [Croceibacterium ferulae]|uniref:EamA family transporter n=1 Tax=Croceibacterium ferulae TaxID=1854641 RepID=UPI000EABEC50|nr:EamA family transporter [Croceibacterium ferulae]